MKRSLLMVLCLSVVSAFAGVYDIEEFSAKDAGTPDDYIVAEFGGTLKVAPADEVESLQEGRLVVRQKFEDPFGESETSYQLYQGGKGDLSSMTALTADGVDYSKLISAKLYERRGMSADKDVEKVYFDGKYVYIPGATSAITFVNGIATELKGEAPAASASTAPAQECDEFDVSCDEDILAAKNSNSYNVSGDLNSTNSRADARDYSASAAAQDVKDRFGIADEVRFWSAVALSAIAAGSAVIGVLQQMKASEADKAYKDLDGVANIVSQKIEKTCKEGIAGVTNQDACISYYKNTRDEGAFMFNNWNYAGLQDRMKINKDTKDSYAMGRNIWFGVSALTLTTAIVLFAW